MAEKKEPQEQLPLVDQSATIEQLQKQLQKLEKQLQFERDRNLALNTLIDVIEEHCFKVRKKAGVKR